MNENDNALAIINRINAKVGGESDASTLVEALLALERALDNAGITANAQKDGGEHADA